MPPRATGQVIPPQDGRGWAIRFRAYGKRRYIVRGRFLAAAVERANTQLSEDGRDPIVGATPHALRRTCVSLLLAAGADVPYVMAPVGHTDPKMTLGVYAQVIASDTDHGAALDGLVGASDWAATGSESPETVLGSAPATETRQEKTPR